MDAKGKNGNEVYQTYYDVLKSAIDSDSQLELLRGKEFPVSFHDEPPEFFASSTQGTAHFCRVDTKGKSTGSMANLQYSVDAGHVYPKKCPALDLTVIQHEYTCRGCYVCPFALDALRNTTHTEVDLDSELSRNCSSPRKLQHDAMNFSAFSLIA